MPPYADPEVGFALVDDLQDPASPLPEREQNSLRSMLALRVMRYVSRRSDLTAEDLDVIELLVARWSRAWGDINAGTERPYAVQIAMETIAEVCAMEVPAAAAALDRLTSLGLIGEAEGTWNEYEDDGPELSLAGLFDPVLKEVEPKLLRDLHERYKAELRKMALFYVAGVDGAVEALKENPRVRLRAREFLADWRRFQAQPTFDEILRKWERHPGAAFAWFEDLMRLQERADVLYGYPSEVGSLRAELGKQHPWKIAVLSDRYASARG